MCYNYKVIFKQIVMKKKVLLTLIAVAAIIAGFALFGNKKASAPAATNNEVDSDQQSENNPKDNVQQTQSNNQNTQTPPPTGTVFSNGQDVPAPTFAGLIGGASNQASTLNTQAGLINQTASQIGAQTQMSPAEQQANQAAAALEASRASALGDVGTQGWSAAFQQGQEGLINRNIDAQEAAKQAEAQTFAAQRQANATALGAEAGAQNQAGGLQSSAGGILNSAASTAAPTVGQQGQTQYQPLNAGTNNGGSGSVSLTGVVGTDVSNLSNAVNNGTLDYQSALSQLSGYGTAVQNQLLPAIQKLNPNFNFNLSGSSAQTQAQGQQLNTQVATANQALDSLGTSFSSLSGLQTGGIPATNSIAQWIGTQLGDQALSKYQSNLADARAQLVGVLNAAGGTPTGNEATAMQYLPDNMTPAMFQANVGTAQNPGIVRQLMQQKASTFSGSGQQSNTSQNGTSNTNSSSLYNF